jgi:hypothetical protein
MNATIPEILLIFPSSRKHLLELVKIERFFLIGPLLVAQFASLDIDRYLLLFGPFEDIKHIAEEDKAYPAIHFFSLLGQHVQVVFDQRIQQH